jgi:hypothetical protein
MYGGALANMALSMDPFTANRYAFAGGNPISFVELDGHLFGMSWSDIGHAALDVAGLVPVIGEAADVVNGLWYMAEGNYVDGALSMASAIPFAGYAATAAKWGRKGMKAAGAVADSTKAAKKVKKAAKTAKKAKKAEAKPKPKAKSDDGPTACPVKREPHSFVPGTQVRMADGTSRAINDLDEGDFVWATDPETGKSRARQVTDVRSNKGWKHLITVTVDVYG